MRIKIRKNFRKNEYSIFLYLGAMESQGVTSQTQIARGLEMPITTVNYHITKLKAVGLINKFLELTPSGKRLFQELWNKECLSMKLRAHNLQVMFTLLKCPSEFPHCYTNKIFKPFSNGKYKAYKTDLEDISILFYSRNKLVCVLPDIYADNEKDIGSAIAHKCSTLKDRLEQEFKGIKIKNYEISEITHMHVAKPKSIIAKSFFLSHGNYKSAKIEIDRSKGDDPEIEAVDPETALYDIGIIKEVDKIKEMIKERGVLKKKGIKKNPKKEIVERIAESHDKK